MGFLNHQQYQYHRIFFGGRPGTVKRQSHHSPVSFQTPQWRRRIQYVISLSSLMVLPTLNAHATRLKILENSAKFHWISPFCMVRSRKKQCYVSIFLLHFAMSSRHGDYIPRTLEIITGYVQSAWQGNKKSCA